MKLKLLVQSIRLALYWRGSSHWRTDNCGHGGKK
jgi:hypothetical protein